MADWFIYIIQDDLKTFYTGVTIDVDRRFSEHVEGGRKAAKYLKSRKNLELVYKCKIGDKREAYRIETRIKSLGKEKKKVIVDKQMKSKALKEFLKLAE